MVFGPLLVAAAKKVGIQIGLEALSTAAREFGKRVGRGNVRSPSDRGANSMQAELATLQRRVDASETEMVALADQLAATTEKLEGLFLRLILMGTASLALAVAAFFVALLV